MKGLLIPIPDLTYDIEAFATDDERNSVSVYGVVHGTQVGEAGPVPPTGNPVTAGYVYVMGFDGDKIRHMTKIWNDGHTLKQLGWVSFESHPAAAVWYGRSSVATSAGCSSSGRPSNAESLSSGHSTSSI